MQKALISDHFQILGAQITQAFNLQRDPLDDESNEFVLAFGQAGDNFSFSRSRRRMALVSGFKGRFLGPKFL